MSKARLVPDAKAELALAALRPSEYTAALIQVLQAKAALVRGAKVLEIGSGSGVVLAALGELGAASLCGIDIEEDAVARACCCWPSWDTARRRNFISATCGHQSPAAAST